MKRFLTALLAAALLFALAACGGNTENPVQTGAGAPAETGPASTPAPAANPSGSTAVTLGYAGSHDCIYPSSTVSNDYSSAMLIYDLLLEMDDVTGEIKSRVLSNWEWEDDVTIRLDLKDGIYFSDGKQMTGEDVLFSIYNYVAPGGRTDKFQHYKYIDFDASHVSDDGMSVYVVWSQPYSPAFRSLVGCSIMEKAFTEAHDESDEIWYTAPVGSGPFRVKDCMIDSYVTFEARDDYWDASEYSYDCTEITIRYYSDETAMYVDYQNGTLDALYNVSSTICEQIEQAGNQGTVSYIPKNDVTLLMMNEKHNPALADPAVREAIAYALDMDSIAALSYGVLYKPATSHLASSFDAYRAHEGYQYDPDHAKQVLESAGYKAGDITLDFIAANVDPQPKIAEAVQGYLSVIGINVEVQNLDLGTALVYFQDGENDLSVMQVTGGNPTKIPMSIFNGMNATTPMKDKSIADPTFNSYIDAGTNTTDESAANEAFAKADDWLYENYHALPIAETLSALAYNNRIAAFPQSAIGRGCLASIDLAD